jgi:hypothetical protein
VQECPFATSKVTLGLPQLFVIDGANVVTLSVEAIEASNLVSTSIETSALIAWVCIDAHAP